MPVATMQLVTQLLIFIVHGGAPQLIQVVFKGDWAVVADQWMPLGDDAGVLDTLIMGGGAIVVSMVNTEAPSAVLPQGTVPFGVVGLLVTTFETIGEGGTLALVSLAFWDSACLQTVFAFNVTPLVFRWPLSSKDMG